MKIYHKCDGGLSHPNFCIHLKVGYGVKDHLMAKLFTNLLKNDLNESIFHIWIEQSMINVKNKITILNLMDKQNNIMCNKKR